MRRRSRSPLTRSQTVAAALRHLRAIGGDPQRIIAELDLPPTSETDPHATLTLHQMHDAMDAIAKASGDPLLGIHLAREILRGAYEFYPLLEYLGRCAPTVRHHLNATARFSPLGNEVAVLRLEVLEDLALFETLVPGQPLCLGRHANECVQQVTLANLARYTGTPFPVEQVWMAHDAPDDPESVRAAMSVPRVEFGRGTNGIVFRRELLDRPMRHADARLFDLLYAHGDHLLATRQAKSRFLGQVRQTIADQFGVRLPTIESTARMMRTSARSLQRRLSDEETTFQAMLDSVREELARAYLKDRHRQVSDVAIALHYSDTSAFVRAFRRWTGTTPGVFRQ